MIELPCCSCLPFPPSAPPISSSTMHFGRSQKPVRSIVLLLLFTCMADKVSWFTIMMSRNRSDSPVLSSSSQINAHIEINDDDIFIRSPCDMATEAPIQVINPLCRMDSASTIRSQSPQAMAMASGPERPSSFVSDNTHSSPSTTSHKQFGGKYSSMAAARKKKSVTFFNAAKLYRMKSVPLASVMSQREKDTLWYASKDYEGFKYDAATQAGIRLVRYERGGGKLSSSNQPNFVMLGNFDDYEVDGGGSEGDASRTTDGGRLHYNENEYNEPPSGEVCKRGLGYHFSRHRKRDKLITKGAVTVWQRALKDPTNPKYAKLKVDSSGKGQGRASFILALVANKCAKIPAEEARWRGEMDYFAAYPDRHVGVNYPNLPDGSIFSPKTPIEALSSQNLIETNPERPEKPSMASPENFDDRKRPASFDGSDGTSVQSNKKARPGGEERNDPSQLKREEELFASPMSPSFDNSDSTPVQSNKKVRPGEEFEREEEFFTSPMSPPMSPVSFDMLSDALKAEV